MDEQKEPLLGPQELVPQLSKNALKRQLKRQRWEDSRKERQARKKAKRKGKKEALKLSGQKPKGPRSVSVKKQQSSGIRVVIDCAFDELMSDKEITSMSLQLTRCYAENKKALNTFEMHITSLNRRLGERMETVMQGVHHRWKGVEVSCDPYETVLKEVAPSNIVYLTADSPNVIRSLETEKVYIIGGIIDKNRWKGLCYEKAMKQGVQHARLPIDDYIKMSTRHVLTINQVLEIMLQWLQTHDWEKAFMEVIPKRKMPEARNGGERTQQADIAEIENGKDIFDDINVIDKNDALDTTGDSE